MSTHNTRKSASSLGLAGWSPREIGPIAGLILLFFLVMCLSSVSTAKGIALVAALCGISRWPHGCRCPFWP